MGKELVGGEPEPHLDLSGPLEHLRNEEHEAEEHGEESIRQRGPEGPITGRLDASCHGPRTHQQNEGVEDPDAEVQLRLRLQVELSLIHISEPTRLLSISYAVF